MSDRRSSRSLMAWQSRCCCRSVDYVASINSTVMPFLNIMRPFRVCVHALSVENEPPPSGESWLRAWSSVMYCKFSAVSSDVVDVIYTFWFLRLWLCTLCIGITIDDMLSGSRPLVDLSLICLASLHFVLNRLEVHISWLLFRPDCTSVLCNLFR